MEKEREKDTSKSKSSSTSKSSSPTEMNDLPDDITIDAIPALVNSESVLSSVVYCDWLRIPFLTDKGQEEFIKDIDYDYSQMYLDYICYVRSDMEQLYTEYDKKDVCPGTTPA